MISVNRKLIEDYFQSEWKESVSDKTLDFLIELTCQSYKLNQPQVPNFLINQEPPKPQDLGKI